MSSEKKRDFLHCYQSNYFQETPKDLFKTADAKRKCIAETFKTSAELLNNTASCGLVDEMLSSYTDLVDDQNNINNYADSLKVLTSNLDKTEYSEWKSGLNSVDIKELIKPLNCGSIECKNTNVTMDQISVLFHKDNNDFNDNIHVESVKPEVVKENLFGVQNCSKFDTNNFGNNSVQNVKKTSKYDVFCNNSAQNFQHNYNKSNTNNSYKNITKESNVEDRKDKFGMFKTAKAELHAQNIKKYGKAEGSVQQQSSLNYGAQKRSLGTRRGVQNKFVPPLRADYNESERSLLQRYNNNSNPSSQEEEIDDRLKNIDAKMVELIRSEIMDSGPPVSWDDIAGLEFAKTAIKEAVIWPLLRPDIFTGLRRPPKGILLFGPPGTGKTLIGKCIASQSQSTFFSISASSLTSKWIGDGEKMVRAMFAVARCHQPAVIFIDEIDSLLSQRSDTEHESSRRIKTEFLVQLDGASTAEDDRILLVGATNRPQELDEAARRRFVKRLYIPLPEKSARLEIVSRLMNSEKNNLNERDISEIADLSNGYSGADMKNLCSEASLGPIRSIDINLIQNIEAEQVRPVTMGDFKTALNRVRASVSPADLDQYVLWDKTYGSGGW